jgi:hypothetical protein
MLIKREKARTQLRFLDYKGKALHLFEIKA